MKNLYCIIALFCIPALGMAAAPGNDAFENAAELTAGLMALTAYNTDATTEAGESIPPSYDPVNYTHTVWWNWTAPSSANYVISTQGSDFDTVLAVWTGVAVNDLTLAGDDDESGGGGTSLLTLRATAGVHYHIAVASWDNSKTGLVSLKVQATTPINDNFARAKLLSGPLPLFASVENFPLATVETGEPRLTDGFVNLTHTVWWKWTPTSAAPVVFAATEDSSRQVVHVFTGNSLTSLVPVPGLSSSPNGSQITFHPTIGQSYYLRCASDRSFFSIPALYLGGISLRYANPPANDLVENAVAFPSQIPAALPGTMVDATRSNGANDDPEASAARTIWYKWTASASGSFDLLVPETTQLGEPFLGVYRRDLSGHWIRMGSGGLSFSSFFATLGETYYFMVYERSALNTDNFHLKLQAAPAPPPNDAYDHATVLTGLPSVLQGGTVAGATWEVEESVSTGEGSVWYAWTAQQDGLVTGVAGGLDFLSFYFFLEVYEGVSLSTATVVSDSSNRWHAVNGHTYHLRITGARASLDGGGKLKVQVVPVPPNDDFNNAVIIGGPRYSIEGTNAGAGTGPGENNASSVWYRWTAPITARVAISTRALQSGRIRPAVEVTTGASASSLSPVPFISGVYPDTFLATAGVTYNIRVTGYVWAADGDFTLRLWLPPANDNFASAALLTGNQAILHGALVGGDP